MESGDPLWWVLVSCTSWYLGMESFIYMVWWETQVADLNLFAVKTEASTKKNR